MRCGVEMGGCPMHPQSREAGREGAVALEVAAVDQADAALGATPLAIAAERGHAEVVRVLLKARVRPVPCPTGGGTVRTPCARDSICACEQFVLFGINLLQNSPPFPKQRCKVWDVQFMQK